MRLLCACLDVAFRLFELSTRMPSTSQTVTNQAPRPFTSMMPLPNRGPRRLRRPAHLTLRRSTRFSTMTRTYSVRFHPFREGSRRIELFTGFADALSNGELFHLDMGLLKTANSTAIPWVDVEKAPFASGYEPVMALAQNHIFFLNVPGVTAGSASIYVIHCELESGRLVTPLTWPHQTTTSSLRHKPSRRQTG